MYIASYSNKRVHEVFGSFLTAHEARMILLDLECLNECIYHRLYDKLEYKMLNDNNKKEIKSLLEKKFTRDQENAWFIHRWNPLGETVENTVDRYIKTNLWKTLIPKTKILQYFNETDYDDEANRVINYGCCGTTYKITDFS